MKIKGFIITVFACFFSITISAQVCMNDSIVIANEDSCSTESIQAAIDACMLLAGAAESKDTIAFRKAKEAMEECNCSHFCLLRYQNRYKEE